MPRVSPTVAAGPGGWSDEAIERLKALWLQDELSAAIIARRLGVSRNAVLGKVHRLGLSNRRPASGPSRPKPAPKPKRGRPVRVVPATKPVPPPKVAAATWTGLVRRLERLPAHSCHWPLGDPQEAAFAWCGRPAGERIYCDVHWALGHAPRPRA